MTKRKRFLRREAVLSPYRSAPGGQAARPVIAIPGAEVRSVSQTRNPAARASAKLSRTPGLERSPSAPPGSGLRRNDESGRA